MGGPRKITRRVISTSCGVFFVVTMFCCVLAGPATQPTTQPHEETAIERAYRRLHARQAAEAAAATRPAKAPTSRPGSYPIKVAREMNGVLHARDLRSMTSAAIDDMWHSEQQAVNGIAAAHTGEEWEFTGTVEDVVSGQRYYGGAMVHNLTDAPEAVAIFHVVLPLPPTADENLRDALNELQKRSASDRRAHLRAAQLDGLRARPRGTIEVQGSLKDFASWRPGGFYSVHVWTKGITASVTSPTGVMRTTSINELGCDYLESMDITCILHPVKAGVQREKRPTQSRELFGPQHK